MSNKQSNIQGERPGQHLALPTGFPELDRLLQDGVKPGDLWVIGGRPGNVITGLKPSERQC
jgi:replicative DNA helicase